MHREELDGNAGIQQPQLTSCSPVARWACHDCPVLRNEGQGSTALVRPAISLEDVSQVRISYGRMSPHRVRSASWSQRPCPPGGDRQEPPSIA